MQQIPRNPNSCGLQILHFLVRKPGRTSTYAGTFEKRRLRKRSNFGVHFLTRSGRLGRSGAVWGGLGRSGAVWGRPVLTRSGGKTHFPPRTIGGNAFL